MAPVGSMLWRSLRVWQVYGANTEVGKTVLTTTLCKAARNRYQDEVTAYLKPVSTGPLDEADSHHIQKYAQGVSHATLHQYDLAISPHAAARGKLQLVPSDKGLLESIYAHAAKTAANSPGWLFIETAGGVHSPGPSGASQAELYKPLRCPVVLIGDPKLGGISLTISAFESLKIRGYDVEAILLFREDQYNNWEYLTEYFKEHYNIPVYTVSPPPARDAVSAETDAQAMKEYYKEASRLPVMHDILKHLDSKHKGRITRLESMATTAHEKIWYPFTQQKLVTPASITAIDSANADFFQTLVPQGSRDDSKSSTPLLQPSFDGSASWWTQGLGHGSTSLTLAAAYAAGRYGHVMFAEAVHEPALALAETLLGGMANPRLTRVFYSDDGSTGVEVAVKMGLRAARVRYGWPAGDKLGIIGLKGGYHGDTIGAMDCAEPSAFNEKVEWYEGKGMWFDTPSIKCVNGKWVIEIPEELRGHMKNDGFDFDTLSDVFDIEQREKQGSHEAYEKYIEETLQSHLAKGRKFGAVLLEPVVLGAGGMILADPLFQRALVNVVRRSADLFGVARDDVSSSDKLGWTGLPIIFDEVFTGLYRLGRFSASSFLNIDADISVHAKLLTGGLVPLCTTLASESILRAFESDDKTDALLHGHSYTAHPVGCNVATESLRQMQAMERNGDWDWAKSGGWSTSTAKDVVADDCRVWSIWSSGFIDWLSRHPAVAGAWALGSVLAIHLHAPDGSGYTSNVAASLRDALRTNASDRDEAPWNIHSRVLGNVLYCMGGQRSTGQDIRELENVLRRALDKQ
ncbi:hypothetical protein PFICI_05463 [Pestalotiopsis fici W106-1]|uniref:Bifunctional dethiobiotin synthetase/7,8-diamino-pelargonic acid aminotransferase n=1 Tax=Pestalotiopsis fici (strain W106-1 / CGMCC3.15140) TaxID=1229662 RepID=W3XDT5_PESFW|nr:uncharacterized protein PFICI_05463 [Pestalotiopsis fici W106-1]ETS83587.1 hypothetical protein PFICI_05463 [Pestalotiopsis fici W106-1]